MKVYFAINNHGDPQESLTCCGKIGDIIEILPTPDIGKEAEKLYSVISKDIKIPCGDGVLDAAGVFGMSSRGPLWNCGICKYNDPDDCERTKYLRYDFDAGTLFDPPKIVQKRIYAVDNQENIIDTRSV